MRRYLLQQTMSLAMSIRDGQWKYLDHKGSGGNNYQRDGAWGMKPYALNNNDPDAPGQLYDLATDPGETHNLYSKNPAIVESDDGATGSLQEERTKRSVTSTTIKRKVEGKPLNEKPWPCHLQYVVSWKEPTPESLQQVRFEFQFTAAAGTRFLTKLLRSLPGWR